MVANGERHKEPDEHGANRKRRRTQLRARLSKGLWTFRHQFRPPIIRRCLDASLTLA
jgi:hypothetical protein